MTRRVVAMLAALLSALLIGTPASAAGPFEGPHIGHYGQHWLLSSSEYPTLTCIYDGTGVLHRIRLRRPIVFAYDGRPGKLDRQDVAWRFIVEYNAADGSATYSDWPDWPGGHSSLKHAFATDLDPAPFRSRSFTLASKPATDGSQDVFRVSYRLFWYRNGSVDGRTTDVSSSAKVPATTSTAGAPIIIVGVRYECPRSILP